MRPVGTPSPLPVAVGVGAVVAKAAAAGEMAKQAQAVVALVMAVAEALTSGDLSRRWIRVASTVEANGRGRKEALAVKTVLEAYRSHVHRHARSRQSRR